MKQRKVEATVKTILTNSTMARADDHYLYYCVVKTYTNDEFVFAFIHHKHLQLPTFESVSRARRRVQAKFPELRADEKTEQARLDKEIDFYNYYTAEANNG